MTMVKVAVVGADGRMGTQTVHALTAAADLDLVAQIGRDDSLELAQAAGASVIVDFTSPDSVMDTVEKAISLGLHAVIGTSGFDDNRLATVRNWLDARSDVGVVIAPNFAMGAVLLMRFAKTAARFFESVEIIELHHPDKVDAPSGTAQHTARVIADARASMSAAPDATKHAIPGARGADVAGIPVHSVRLRGLVAHEEVLFGGPGETLTIRHDSLDRSGFMPGVLLAVRSVGSHPGLTLGLEPLLDEE
ncbi:MAG: 4-hydroxy-tetrahydrodipicolinate reductase [Candidatus Nanopelagicales bacterium]